MKTFYKLALIISVFGLFSCNQKINLNEKELSGPYLGQTPPDTIPTLFAPGIVSTGMYERDIAIMPDGKEIYFGLAFGSFTYTTIIKIKEENGSWTDPEIMEYMTDPNIMNLEPTISPDGKKFFFLSNRIDSINGDSVIGDQDIWVMNRIGDSWSKPYNLGEPVNSDQPEYFPSITNDGSIYFSRADPVTRIHYIFKSQLKDGKYLEPAQLPVEVNSGRSQFNAFVAPDESYIIVPTVGREDTFGGCDYYISFKNGNNEWIKAINMGNLINSTSNAEWSPFVSRDGKYFFFMATHTNKVAMKSNTYYDLKQLHNKPENGNSDIYWVSTRIFDNLRMKNQHWNF